MKKHILRAPQTDRYALNVPTSAADLADTAVGDVSFRKLTCAVLAPGTNAVIACPTTVAATGMTADGTGLAVTSPGLYLVTFSVTWASPAFGTHVGTIAPQSSLRTVNLDQNASNVATAATSGERNGTDRGTVLVRCAAGDTLQVHAANNDGAGTGTYSDASVQALLVAP